MSEVIASKIWPTFLLLGTVMIASAAIGLTIGIYGGWRHGSRFDDACSSRHTTPLPPVPTSASIRDPRISVPMPRST